MNYRPGDMVQLQNADGVQMVGQIVEIDTDTGDVTVLLETGTLVTYTTVQFMSDLEELW